MKKKIDSNSYSPLFFNVFFFNVSYGGANSTDILVVATMKII